MNDLAYPPPRYPVLPQFVDENFINEFRPNESHEKYHSDFTKANSSTLKLFYTSAAAVYSHYLIQAPIDNEEPDDDLSEPVHFRLGRALHAASLETKRFMEHVIQVPDFKGEGSRAAKKKWIGSQKPGAIILKAKEYIQVEGMVNSILACPDAVLALRSGIPEYSGYYRDPETGIACRIKPDLWNEELGILLDVKTCRDSSPDAFSKQIKKHMYHLSMSMYADGIAQITGKRPNQCILLAVESKPPYECAVYICIDRMLQEGHEAYQFAMQKLRICLETGHWPARQSGMAYIDLPEWHYNKKELFL